MTGGLRDDYRVIYADPPWKSDLYNKSPRHAARHYPVLHKTEIMNLPQARLGGPDCWLFLWTTWQHLQQAMETMAAWGFKYSSNAFLWAKLNRREASALMFDCTSFHMGLGSTTRKNTEVCLLGRRGSPGRKSGAVRELIIAPVREHSRKPDETRMRIEQFSDGPYLELFARSTRQGWDCWGNETEKFADQLRGQAENV